MVQSQSYVAKGFALDVRTEPNTQAADGRHRIDAASDSGPRS